MHYLCVVEKAKKIILFDGLCNVCNGFVQFVIKRDHKDVFQFTSLQSDVGQRLLKERKIDTTKIDSVVLIEPGVAFYIKSDAALEVGKSLKGYRTVSKIFQLIPSKIRDIVYDLIAKYRYAWFGKREDCMVPSPEIRAKFL
ncbi:DUF393 domain-containing protein [Maribacter flavus]|uniref:DUF393 domain-containing protein n=1 Tax=Maribacter flavus TaxID=1658664 RepID=A0A5B2TQX7_9FLAO|nr:DUF393 domain-containing protein [Maribacter flavus]